MIKGEEGVPHMSDRLMLAISVGHNASAALMRNGVIVSAALEERFARIKNYVGYPKQAIDYCLKKEGVRGDQLHRFACTTISYPGLIIKAKTSTNFSLRDYIDYYGERYYGRKLRGEDCSDYLRWLNTTEQFNRDAQYFDFSYLTDEVLLNPKQDILLFRKETARLLSSHIGVSQDKVEFIDHHTCHAHYAYFGSPFRGEDCVALTMDSWGDGRNQTVWMVKNDQLSLLADSVECDVARIYKMATLILSMRPDEHEFKVMGLAPYAKPSHAARAMKVIENILDVDGMRVVNKVRPKDLYGFLVEGWKDHRFDSIAGAVQAYTELIAKRLVVNIARQTGVSRFVLSGGVSMNVKMNKAIAELDEVSAFYVCGSGGDESLAIGGCYYLNKEAGNNRPLRNMYLGFDITDEIADFDIEPLKERYKVSIGVEPATVAALLLKGDIVAVVRGRAEFGARALGNRSILANPSKRETVRKINEAIKNRDFWMPFALSILEDRHGDYLYNSKRLQSPVMAISFDARPERYSEIEAGTHPYDRTVRGQFVSKEQAPEYYRLISEFHKMSGIPALLNTSFNLHGEPIVDTIGDALRTFELSGLDHLLIQDQILLSKPYKD
jgi:carbamoyltransferase